MIPPAPFPCDVGRPLRAIRGAGVAQAEQRASGDAFGEGEVGRPARGLMSLTLFWLRVCFTNRARKVAAGRGRGSGRVSEWRHRYVTRTRGCWSKEVDQLHGREKGTGQGMDILSFGHGQP